MIQFFVKQVKKINKDRQLANDVNALMPKLALMFEAEVKRRTPVVTGRLKNGMVGEQTGFLKAAVKNNVKYAAMVEYGTSRFEPRAMFRNGAAAMKTAGLEFIKAKLKV